MSEPRRRVPAPPPTGDQNLDQYLRDVADVLNGPDVEVREFIQLSTTTTISPQATTVYLFDASSEITVTLPLARKVRNFHFYIKNLSTNVLTVATQGSEQIDLLSSFGLIQNSAVRVSSDNTKYWIL